MALSDSIYPCEECGRRYNHILLDECPSCNRTEGSGVTKPKSVPKPADFETHDLLRQVLIGVNRTTYAVRAVVSLTAILIVTSGIVFMIQLLSALAGAADNESLAGFLNFLSWVVALVGIFIAYREFFSEWRKSKVPERY